MSVTDEYLANNRAYAEGFAGTESRLPQLLSLPYVCCTAAAAIARRPRLL